MNTAAAMVTSSSKYLLRKKMAKISRWAVLVQFVLYAGVESILKPADEQYREEVIKVKTEIKDKTPWTEKINTHVLSGWCVQSTFAYGDVPDPLKMYFRKDCV